MEEDSEELGVVEAAVFNAAVDRIIDPARLKTELAYNIQSRAAG